jgi:hypothetical protein
MPTATEIIGGAFDLLNIKSPGQAVEGNDAVDGLKRLNYLIESWSLQPMTALVTREFTFTGIVADQRDYTIGSGAEIDVDRPTSIIDAWLVMTTVDTVTKIHTPLITNQAWQAITTPELTSTMWTQVFYNPTYTSIAEPWGTVSLWPAPTVCEYDLLLYLPVDVQRFADLTTVYALAPGYAEALEYNLAWKLAAPYGRQLPPDVRQIAIESLSLLKRNNLQRMDLGVDLALLTPMGRGPYNILSDT